MDSSAPLTTATGSADYRRVPFFSRNAPVAKFQAIFEEIPLSLLCFWFGTLIYAASLGTVAAMLLLGGTLLVVSFVLLPVQRLCPPLISSALGFSARRAITAVDFAPGAHSARVFTDLN